ncbi:hypothetical protein [Roseinatronobacter monicus]|uniref:hypothetical protein n=1 Tax=Roseinatronobacter monicus TaxID=393481 RepID=UPI003F3E19ED
MSALAEREFLDAVRLEADLRRKDLIERVRAAQRTPASQARAEVQMTRMLDRLTANMSGR